jgi:hypothetical protein
VRYPLDSLIREVAFISYYFHWSRDEILDVSHLERRLWVEEISRINRRINEDSDRPDR